MEANDSPFLDSLSVADYEALASTRLPPEVWGYFSGGAEDEATLRWNREAFARHRILPRVLRGVGSRSPTTTVLGIPVDSPVLVAPMAYQRLAHPEGECATARGAGRRGTILVVSTLAYCSLEAVAAASLHPLWFQLYVYRDRDLTRSLVERAARAGYRALVLTVDTPVLGSREREVRTGFRASISPSDVPQPQGDGISDEARATHRLLDPDLTWDDIAWLRSISPMPIVVKGILHPADAKRAAEAGVDGLVVSNHGGRQLDGAVATLDALPGVVEAVDRSGGACEVYLDGGVRRGVDVLRALALGARAVLVGRPILWGLAVGGAEGVARVLEILTLEFDRALALSGMRSPDEVRREGRKLFQAPPILPSPPHDL
jgi:4-hydroxymandelate oxidase